MKERNKEEIENFQFPIPPTSVFSAFLDPISFLHFFSSSLSLSSLFLSFSTPYSLLITLSPCLSFLIASPPPFFHPSFFQCFLPVSLVTYPPTSPPSSLYFSILLFYLSILNIIFLPNLLSLFVSFPFFLSFFFISIMSFCINLILSAFPNYLSLNF